MECSLDLTAPRYQTRPSNVSLFALETRAAVMFFDEHNNETCIYISPGALADFHEQLGEFIAKNYPALAKDDEPVTPTVPPISEPAEEVLV